MTYHHTGEENLAKSSSYGKSKEEKEAYLVKFLKECYDESDSTKHTRMELNRNNFDIYHLRHDFSHKKKGQSKEVLAKVAMAVEQIRSFFQQAPPRRHSSRRDIPTDDPPRSLWPRSHRRQQPGERSCRRRCPRKHSPRRWPPRL